jgi:hypothetical protein
MNMNNVNRSLDLSLVNLHVQFVGLAFMILTFVIMFYAQALNRDRKVENFIDWIRNYALVWIGLSVPVIFVTTGFTSSFLWGFVCGCERMNNTTCEIFFNAFLQMTEPFIWIVYSFSGIAYLIEVPIISSNIEHKRLKTFAQLCLVYGVIILIVAFSMPPQPLVVYLWLIAYVIWIVPPAIFIHNEDIKTLLKNLRQLRHQQKP